MLFSFICKYLKDKNWIKMSQLYKNFTL